MKLYQMKKLSILVLFLTITTIFFSCNWSENIESEMDYGQTLLADKEFKSAIALIELHKVRYGSYPDELSELKHISSFDAGLGSAVQYHKFDSGYALNLIMEFPSIQGGNSKVVLEYPKEFWEGLGCIESNAMVK